MRHGEANSALEDPLRGLSDKGQKGIKRVANAVQKAGAKPKIFYHSGKQRTKQTAEITRDITAPHSEIERIEGIKPNDPPEGLLPLLGSLHEDTLIVSHLPFLPKLTGLLIVNLAPRVFLEFKPGSVVCLDSDDKQQWMIDWVLSPDLCKP